MNLSPTPSAPGLGRRPQLAVIGGGIAGLSGALAAHRAGCRVRVFEQASRSRAGGGPLWLPANALRALKRLGVHRTAIARSTELMRYTVLSPDRRVIFSLPVGELKRKYGEPLVVIGRRDLLRALESSLPDGTSRFGAACRDYRQWHTGVSPVFEPLPSADPSAAPHPLVFDGLIGCDGFNSSIRGHLQHMGPLEAVGGWVWTGMSPRVVDGPRPVGAAELTLGRGQTFLSLPLQPVADGEPEIAWWAASADPNPASFDRLFNLGPGPAAILNATREASRMNFAIRDRHLSTPWGNHRVTLLGDSAHPMTPALGQGAAQAIEGAVVLGDCLARHRGNIPGAFRDYEQQRRQRVARIVRFARFLGAGLTLPIPSPLRRLTTWSALPSLFAELDFMLRHESLKP